MNKGKISVRELPSKSFEGWSQLRHSIKVSSISAKTLEQYEKLLAKEPRSKVFAALADAYREKGRLKDALKTATDGIDRHPDYVGGYLACARVLSEMGQLQDAEKTLKKAIELSPENLLAYQLLGQVYVELKRPHDALKAHKMVLFLNPLAERSRQAVEKLETLTAVDYEDDLFEMRQLKETPLPPSQKPPEEHSLDRHLSYIDALIVRNDLKKAREFLYALSEEFPESAEVRKRWDYFDEEITPPQDEILKPLASREKKIWERKKILLESILGRIEQHRHILG
ncbi:MAG: hypothetical protein C5B49_13060 [Bdellovibrio sp.]|nr:MAG: hypothetical protein C5B49_13060 [Bdellovibrio sp.]